MKFKLFVSSIAATFLPKIAHSYYEHSNRNCDQLKSIYDTNPDLQLFNNEEHYNSNETAIHNENESLLTYLINSCDGSFSIEETNLNTILLGTQDDQVK
jgi:hypothetical protein